jgi:signal transduction histidine kinase
LNKQQRQPAPYGGTGLGLAIVKQISRTQGGSIIAQSETAKVSFGFTMSFENELILIKEVKEAIHRCFKSSKTT